MRKIRDVMGREVAVGDTVGVVWTCGSEALIAKGKVLELLTHTKAGKPRKEPEVVVKTGRGKVTCRKPRRRLMKA
jgi:hypothetical protein